MSQFEGRGAKRLDSENLVFYRQLDSEGNVQNEGMVKTIDLSKSGMALEFDHDVENDTHLEVHIGVGEEVVETNTIVRNVKKVNDELFIVGVEFKYLSDEDLNKLAMANPDILS
ncbi:MAG: hypothetical protein GF313_09115 [Caldithrix sp.]|nr:hypothetical protein [Caldithrix sp.]